MFAGKTPITMCHAKSFGYRVAVLCCICLLTFGSYFSYDNPGAMPSAATHLIARNSTSDYALLYSVYSWPNVLLPFVGGCGRRG